MNLWSAARQGNDEFKTGTVVVWGGHRYALVPYDPFYATDPRGAVDLGTGEPVGLYPRIHEKLRVLSDAQQALRLVAHEGFVFAERAPGVRAARPIFDAFKILHPFEPYAARPKFLAQAQNYATAWVEFVTKRMCPRAKGNPERTQPDLVRRCVARVAERLDGPADERLHRAFAICTATMQKSGRMKPGTRKLTPRGAAFERHKRAQPEHAARLDAYETLLDEARQARPPRRVRVTR